LEAPVHQSPLSAPLTPLLINVMTTTPQTIKVDVTDPDHQIAAYEDNIARCAKNIVIFSDEVEKQKILKADLEAELVELKKRLGK
jgi:hypothetical protein